MKKLFTAILTTVVVLSTPALAQEIIGLERDKKDIVLAYKNAKTVFDSGNDREINVLVTEFKIAEFDFLDIRVGGTLNQQHKFKNDYKEYNYTSYWLSIGEDSERISWQASFGRNKYFGTYIQDKVLYVDQNNSKSYDFGLARDIEISFFKIRPLFSYKRYVYDEKDDFKEPYTKKETYTKYGVNFYSDIGSNVQMGVFYARQKYEKVSNTQTSERTDSITNPFIAFSLESGTELLLSYEMQKYDTGERTKSIVVGLGYEF